MSNRSSRTRRAAYSILPARVARAIAVEQDRSEQIIGWFQMGVLTVFVLLFAFAPPAAGMAFDAAAWMRGSMLPALVADVLSFVLAKPVPWALGLYFTATVVRLIWAYRSRLPAWSLVVSIMIDMALLLGLIWSFHIQYGQPPAFYLKAPTLLYVFIFIALRALRSEERYVLVAGAAAAIGWSLLVLYAAAFDPSGMPTTHNYVEYMSSPRILWGAEVDKITSILVVTVVIAWSMRKGRKLLLRAVAEGEAARDLKRFFSPDVALRITGADEAIKPGQGELRDAAIVFIDLRGFTALSQSLPPDQVIQIVGEYQMRVVPIIQRGNGTIDKFLGDGIMATFGCARPSARYAADALTAIDAIMAEAEAWTAERRTQGLPPIKVGAAVATGRVIFGAVGDETRLEYTVIGDAVNLAAKLEKQTKAEKVRALTTADTYRLACEQGFAVLKETRRGVRVGGVADPVDLVVVA